MTTRLISARWLLAAVVAAELVALYLILNNGSWVYDDNFFLVLAGQEGFTWHWLMSVKYEHWDVGMNAVYSLQHALFFFDYRWALGWMLLLLGASTVLFERIVAMFIPDRRVTIAIAAWFGLSILWVRPLQWWAAGVQYFPYTLLDLVCLYGFLRWQAHGGRRWVAASAGGLAGALLFYEKPAYMLPYLALARILLMSDDLRPRAIAQTFWRERELWGAYLAVIAVWGAGYINAHAYVSHPGVGLSSYLTYFRIMWAQTLVPSLASVTIPASHLDALQLVVVIVAELAVGAAIAWSIARRRSAWRSWAFLATVVVLGGVLVARSRISTFGVDIANDPRYLIDFSWLVPLTVVSAFRTQPLLRPIVSSREKRVRVALPAVAGSLTMVALLAYVAVAVASASSVQANWGGPKARTWEQNLRSSFAAVAARGIRPVVVNNATPFEIMEEFVAPYNRLSRVLPLYVGPVQVDGPLDGPLDLVAEHGTLEPASLQPLGQSEAVAAMLADDRMSLSGGRVVMSSGSACMIADATPASLQLRLPAPSVGDAPYYLRLSYRVFEPVALAIYVDSSGVYPDDRKIRSRSIRRTARASPGSARTLLWG